MIKKRELGSFILLLFGVAIALAALEIGSMGYLHIVNGHLPTKEELRSTLDVVDERLEQDDLSVQDTGFDRRHEHVIHPYLGFVRNRDKSRHMFNNRLVQAPINKFGFFGESPADDNDQSKLIVGLFGGSVAAELYLYGGTILQELIQRLPIAKGKTVEVVSVALGGMKQPQQLLALNYLLATGHRFDVVINLDGFNEVALPFSENYPFGIATSYPRSWRAYSAKSVSPEAAQIVGEVRICQNKLSARRAFFSKQWLRKTYTSLALWQTIDRRGKTECSDLEMELRETFSSQEKALGFQEKGPFGEGESESKVFEQSAALWERASIQMWQISKTNRIKYLHILQPNQHVKNSKTFTAYEKLSAIASPNHPYRIAAERGYPLLREIGPRLSHIGVPFYDLTMLFLDEQDSVYKDKCCHLNQNGNALLAKGIADILGSEQNAQ